jgi:hypothetical protein
MPCSTREVSRVDHSSEQVDVLCDALALHQARTRYGSAKLLLLLSERDPAQLYPRFDFFARLLDSDARILRWNSARILGNLACVDRQNKIEKLLDRYLAPIAGPEMIAAANVMQGAAEIAKAKPHLAGRIATAILKVHHATYARPECSHVAAGHAIQALDRFFDHLRIRKPILAFVAAELTNPRPATRKKAEKFLRKWA